VIREINVIKKHFRHGMIKVAIVYPNVYEAMVSSLFINLAYYLLNSYDHIIAERFVLSNPFGEEPIPRSIESGMPLNDFDVILFSVHYEPDYVNIIRMLQAAKIEPLREKRKNKLVIVGGPPLIANPEPLAEIADIIVIGEFESTYEKLIEFDKDLLKSEDGFYVTERGKSEIVKRNWVEDLDSAFYPVKQIIPLDVEPVYGKSFLLETSRGCARACRFCMEGHIFLPKRDRSLNKIKEIVSKGLVLNNVDKVTILSLSYFDHSHSEEILEYLINEMKVKISVPSLRADSLNMERIELIARGGQKSLTIAPETGTLRLGKMINKIIPLDMTTEIAKVAKKLNFDHLKLYFMIGLPGETIDDIHALINYVKSISKIINVKITITPFIPKPHTPFQWVGMRSLEEIKSKISLIKKQIKNVNFYDEKWALIQASLSLGNRELSKVLIKWASYGGGLAGWRKATKDFDLSYVFKGWNIKDELPWSHINLGFEKIIAKSFENFKSMNDV